MSEPSKKKSSSKKKIETEEVEESKTLQPSTDSPSQQTFLASEKISEALSGEVDSSFTNHTAQEIEQEQLAIENLQKEKEVQLSFEQEISSSNNIEENEDDVLLLNENIDEPPLKTILNGIKGYTKKLFKKKEKKKKFEPLPIDSVERFSPSYEHGLSNEQVNIRLSQDLYNHVEVSYSKSYATIFITNLCTFFNFLCIAVAITLLCFNAPLSNYLFVVVLFLNILIGIIQEIKAKKVIDKLSLMSSFVGKVLRDNKVKDIPFNQIVLDDVIILQTGNQIATDSVILSGSIEVNESLLTGESNSIKKNIGDKLFAGSFVTSGNCKAQAIKVGSENYIEKLSKKAKKYKKPNSELIRSLRMIITVIGIIIIPLAVAMFFNNLSNSTITDGTKLADAVLRTSTVVIGMIPSGMFLLTSMALAVGVIRLGKNNTQVQDLYSLEMLARVDVLCLDKTGTITDGRMKVNDCIIINNNVPNTIGEVMGSLLSAVNDNNQTAQALYNHFGHNSLLKAVKTIPFSSKRKFSGATFIDSGTYILGAPEFVLHDIPERVEKTIAQYTSLGLRVLVLAYSKSNINGDEPPANLKAIAIITLSDNIRDDAVSTVKWFRENDVQVKVISGDNPITVSEIAKRVGILNADKFISLEGLSDREIINVANKYTVFGRVSPEQKALLIKAMKSAGSKD